MSDDNHPPVRPEFASVALAAFSCLLELGFRVVRRQETLVRFESSDVFLNVYHGRRSYEVGAEIGRISRADLYSLHEILAAAAPDEIGAASCQTTSSDVLERCLKTIASVLKRKCQPLLVGDAAAFDSLKKVAATSRHVATMRAQYGAILNAADRAWERHERHHAAELYQSAQPALDKVRQRRLEYMRKKGPRKT